MDLVENICIGSNKFTLKYKYIIDNFCKNNKINKNLKYIIN